MDVIEKAQKTIENWNDVFAKDNLLKGDYDGHPFRGNAYVDEFYNPRPSIGITLKNPLKRKKDYTEEEIKELKEKAKNGDKKAQKKLDRLDIVEDIDNKKDNIEKAKKKKSYDRDFEGNQWVDEHGNPRPNAPLGGGKTRKERKQFRSDLRDEIRRRQGKPPSKKRAGRALNNAALALAGSGLKLALDTKGKPVIVASNRRAGVVEWKRDKWERRYLRYKPPEFMFHTKPSYSEAAEQVARQARRQSSRDRQEARRSGYRPDDTNKPVRKIQKDARETICKAYQTVGKVIVYKQEVPRFGDKTSDAFYGHQYYRSHPLKDKKKVDHRFYGNQYVQQQDERAAKKYLAAAVGAGALAGGYRVLNDKKIVDRRRDLFATTIGAYNEGDGILYSVRGPYEKLDDIKATPTGIPHSNVKSVVDDIRERRINASTRYGKPLRPMTKLTDNKVELIPRTKMEARWHMLLYGDDAKEGLRTRNNKLLARSMDTELTYLNQRVKRLPEYAKRAVKRVLRMR